MAVTVCYMQICFGSFFALPFFARWLHKIALFYTANNCKLFFHFVSSLHIYSLFTNLFKKKKTSAWVVTKKKRWRRSSGMPTRQRLTDDKSRVGASVSHSSQRDWWSLWANELALCKGLFPLLRSGKVWYLRSWYESTENTTACLKITRTHLMQSSACIEYKTELGKQQPRATRSLLNLKKLY